MKTYEFKERNCIKIVQFVYEFTRDNHFGPTVNEIRKHMTWDSRSWASVFTSQMVEDGYLKKPSKSEVVLADGRKVDEIIDRLIS